MKLLKMLSQYRITVIKVERDLIGIKTIVMALFLQIICWVAMVPVAQSPSGIGNTRGWGYDL